MSDDEHRRGGSRGASRRLAVALVVGAVVVPAMAGLVLGQPPAGDDPGVVGLPDAVGDAPENGTVLRYEGERLTLAAAPGRAVRGRTDLPPGSVLTVRVQSTGDDQYLRSASTTVGADGGFRATFDLSEVPPGTSLRVVVHRDGRNLTSTSGEVVACEACPAETPRAPSAVVDQDGANLTFADAPGQVLTARTNLPPGAEVTVQLRSTGGASPFIKSTSSTVDGNGTVRATFDFDGVPQGQSFTVLMRYDGSKLTSTQGWVACDGGCGSGSDGASPTPREEGALADAEVGVVQVANGSTAQVLVRLGDAEVAGLSVSAPATSYGLDATLRDGNGDGVVALLFDTDAAGRPAPTVVAAAGPDAVEIHDEGGSFRATDYRLALHPPGDDSVTAATGLLVVTQNGTGGTPLFTTGPDGGSGFPLGSAAALVLGTILAAVGLASLLGVVDVGGALDRL